MATTTTHGSSDQGPIRVGDGVDPAELACPGCADVVRFEPPVEWPARAGAAPLFSHRDGSALCPDSRGGAGEPVEIRAVWA